MCISLCFTVVYGNFDNNFAAKDPLVKKDFQINKIVVGMNLTDVPKVLGKPIKVIKDNRKMICYNYDQFLIKSFYLEGVKERYVDYILVKNKKYSTYRGIRIGSEEKEVIAKYGKPIVVNDDKYYYQTSIEELTYYAINFLIKKSKVKEIEIYMPAD